MTTQIKDRLSDLDQLPDEWRGSEKPNERAITVTRSLIQSMERRGHRVLDVAPIADGGIAVYYVEEKDRHARFDVDNDGGILVAMRPDPRSSTQYMEMSETEAVSMLETFLMIHPDRSLL